MLSYKLLRNHAGVLLAGDYNSLKVLHELIHVVNEKSPLVRNKEGPFLGLAYEVCKAYEQQREVIRPPEFFPEVGIRFGVQILWPELLVQSRILRSSLACIDSSKWDQAVVFNLEAVIESALQDDFGVQAAALQEWWERINPLHPWAETKMHSRGAIFCSWTKAERRKRFTGLLASLDPMYPSLYPMWVSAGDTTLASPDELDSWEGADWPDPKW